MLSVLRHHSYGHCHRCYYHHFAIVGTGPSGLYTAKYLIENYQKATIINNKNTNIESSNNSDPQIYIDFFEKLPTPYGLVRSGVAPDHPEVKSVEETFKKVLNSNNVRFFGNVIIDNLVKNSSIIKVVSNESNIHDSDVKVSERSKHYYVSIDELRESYSAIILAYGATSDIPLPILPDDNRNKNPSTNILSAREFVHWYNGHPDYSNLFINKGLRYVIVI